jgi:hypothetical protein
VLILVIDNEGHILEQIDPIGEENFSNALTTLVEINRKYQRVIYLTSLTIYTILKS